MNVGPAVRHVIPDPAVMAVLRGMADAVQAEVRDPNQTAADVVNGDVTGIPPLTSLVASDRSDAGTTKGVRDVLIDPDLARPVPVHPVLAHPEMVQRDPAQPVPVHRVLKRVPVYPDQARLGLDHVRSGELARVQVSAMGRVSPARNGCHARCRTVGHRLGWVPSANWSRKPPRPHHRLMT